MKNLETAAFGPIITGPQEGPRSPGGPMTAPTGFGPSAQQLWDATVEKYELAPHELRILENACRCVDIIERLEAEIGRDSFNFEAVGSMKQPTEAPEAKLLLKFQARFEQAMKALKLPEEASPAVNPRSSQARDAAAARWSGKRTA